MSKSVSQSVDRSVSQSASQSLSQSVSLCVQNLYHKENEEAYAMYYTVIKHYGSLRTLEKMYSFPS